MALRTHVGGAESDSFATVAEADAYLDSLPDDTTDWSELSESDKELRLQLAAQLMGHLPLRGRTVFRNQRLCFPRTCQSYQTRLKIPSSVKRSQAFLAYSIVHRALVNRPEAEAETDERYGRPAWVSLGGLVSVSFSATPANGSLLTKLSSSLPFPAYQMMKPYLSQFRGSAIDSEPRLLSTTTSVPAEPVTTTTTV